jgi:hypothetical protein
MPIRKEHFDILLHILKRLLFIAGTKITLLAIEQNVDF